MKPAIIIGIIVLFACLISSSVGGYLVMNSSPAPEPETETGESTPPPAEVDGCMDELADNYALAATEDDGSCTYTYDSDNKKLVKNPAIGWSWDEYIENSHNDGIFKPDGQSSETLKKFDTWEECRQYIADNKPDANMIVYRNDTHGSIPHQQTCGYVKLDNYKDGLGAFEFADDTKHTFACTKPGVTVANSCI